MNKTNEPLKEIWRAEGKLYRQTKHLNTREYVKYLNEMVEKYLRKEVLKKKQAA